MQKQPSCEKNGAQKPGWESKLATKNSVGIIVFKKQLIYTLLITNILMHYRCIVEDVSSYILLVIKHTYYNRIISWSWFGS